MPYRNPHQPRTHVQSLQNMLKYAGQTATLRRYVSASAGVADAGLGDSYYYATFTITGIFGGGGGQIGGGQLVANLMMDRPAGMIPAGMLRVVTERPLQADDELTWNNEKYRVDTDSQRSPINNMWMSILVRGGT